MKKYFECDEVLTIVVTLDLGSDLENYMSMWLALCNHCRESAEILGVRNFAETNIVEVTYMVDNKDMKSTLSQAREHASQFGKIKMHEISKATLVKLDRWNDENAFIFYE